jgi:hypothetical protein
MAFTKQEMTVQGFVDLLNGLYQVQDVKGLKLARKVMGNIATLEEFLSPLNKAMEPSDEFKVFAERVKNEAGNDMEKIAELEAQEPELVEQRKEQLKTLQLLLSETKELSLEQIYMSDLPNEVSAKQLKGISPVLKQ